jgi:hypothetical protein
MSEPKTRYQRRIDVLDFQVPRLTRYERFDRVLTTILKEVCAGSELKAEAKGKRILISLGTKGLWEFPTLEVGLRSIGDILEGNIGTVTQIEGDCPGINPLDQELLNGSFLSVSAFGDKVKVCWVRILPTQEIGLKSGGSHRVAQTGVRTLIRDASKLLSLIREAVEAPERIDKVSTLAHRPE